MICDLAVKDIDCKLDARYDLASGAARVPASIAQTL